MPFGMQTVSALAPLILPLKSVCKCSSINPGTTNFPEASITFLAVSPGSAVEIFSPSIKISSIKKELSRELKTFPPLIKKS